MPEPQEKFSMATTAPTQNLPLFYNSVEPLNGDAARQYKGPPNPAHAANRAARMQSP